MKQEYRNFVDGRKFVRKLNLKNGKEWKAYQESIKATQDAFGPENVERFPTLRPKTVTVEKPDYNGPQPMWWHSRIY